MIDANEMEMDGLIRDNMIESMELFIIASLLKGKRVVIPDFGHLEVKSLGGRHTILFKSSKNADSYSKATMLTQDEEEKKNIAILYHAISIPLKEEKLVSLPQVGLFHPIKRENGEIQVSFMPSSFIRKLLSEEDEKLKELGNKRDDIKAEVYIYENKKDKARTDEVVNTKDEVAERIDEATNKIGEEEKSKKSEIKEPVPLRTKDDAVFKPSTLVAIKQSQSDVVVDSQDDNSGKSRNLLGFLLIGIAVFAFLAVAAMTVHSRYAVANKKIDNKVSNGSINLPLLAEQHYGNPVFWIYIYDANKDKLNSPINIPENVSLIIPDLKKDYDVDITDSLEVIRANILADYVLKRGNK